MKKIPCLFQRDFGPDGPGGPKSKGGGQKPVLLPLVTPGCEWALTEGVATVKFDGTACRVYKGDLYVRFDVKIDPRTGQRKSLPKEAINTAIPCTDRPDPVTGHWPHWIRVEDGLPQPQYKYHRIAYLNRAAQSMGRIVEDGTYEACGPHFQSNPEGLADDILIRHGSRHVLLMVPRTFESIREALSKLDIEGFVFYRSLEKGTAGDMCKIRKADYGLPRKPAKEV